jgi:hypothetical protein
MPPTDTPLFATPCIGATISHVQVFPTHVTYEQRLAGDITVPSGMIASVEQHGHEYGFVILSTTSRRRIICMVHRKHADALCAAIRDAYDRPITTSRVSERKKPHSEARLRPKLPSTRSEERAATTRTPPVFPPKESKHSRAGEPVKAKPCGLLRKP